MPPVDPHRVTAALREAAEAEAEEEEAEAATS